MKIGIIAINMFTHGLNFACPLHTFAFQKYLQKIGVESTVICYKPNYDDNFDQKHPSNSFKKKVDIWTKKLSMAEEQGDKEQIKLAKEKINFHKANYSNYQAIYEEREIRYNKFWNFINTNYVKTERIYNCDLLEFEELDFDCYIAVTDVIWGKTDFGYDPGFFLACSTMDNSWKISYSASMLVTKSNEDIDTTRKWIRSQDFVSVRENDLQKRVQNSIRSDVTWVVDPVLLHEADFYNEIAENPKEEEYLFLYYVMDSNPYIVKKAIEYADKYKLKIIVTTDQPSCSILFNNCSVTWEFRYDIGVEEWLGYIQYADIVFTNSFHCCCFSTIFHKQFFAQKRQYDKVSMFLCPLGLENRIINEDDIITEKFDFPIDWVSVSEKMYAHRKVSEIFIQNAINTSKQQIHSKRDTKPDKELQTYRIWYNIGKHITTLEGHTTIEPNKINGKFYIRPKSIEFLPNNSNIQNNETRTFMGNIFVSDSENEKFIGWRVRVVIGKEQAYLLENDRYVLRSKYDFYKDGDRKLFQPGEVIPYIPFNRLKAVIAEAVWSK